MAPTSSASGCSLGEQDGEVPLALVRAFRSVVATATDSYHHSLLDPRFLILSVHKRTSGEEAKSSGRC